LSERKRSWWSKVDEVVGELVNEDTETWVDGSAQEGKGNTKESSPHPYYSVHFTMQSIIMK